MRLVCRPLWGDVPSWSGSEANFGPPENPYPCLSHTFGVGWYRVAPLALKNRSALDS
ncbi:MAG TPA: hypothetical protein VG944_12420 [Fimbriimonas sp.]|nr:hypothetical protein [Fimbriimonas sp.]